MNTSLSSLWARWLIGAAAVVAAIGGCGGGVGEGGTGGGYAQGTINGFGSVIVNDVHYDDTSAVVVDGNGVARTAADLRLGMTVDIVSSPIVTASSIQTATASNIQYAAAIVGPLLHVDVVNGTLAVLGQVVTVDTTTVFDDQLVGGIGALTPGQVVQVYAEIDPAGGRYRATRIEPAASVFAYSLRGIVAQLDATSRSFMVGSAVFSYTSNTPAGLANGGFVRVSLQPAPAGSTSWVVVSFTNGAPKPPDGQRADIKGLISRFDSVSAFSVNGQSVTTSSATGFPDGTAGLGLGVRVEAEGTVAGGVLQATKVSIHTDSQESGKGFELNGSISSVDATAQTFVLHGVVVDYSGANFNNGTVSDIRKDARVQAKGALSRDGTRLQAQDITFSP